MTQLYLVRHGETDFNVEKRFQGQSNQELNSRGFSQAQALRDHLSVINFSTILCSDLRRALQTAEIIAERLGIEPTPNPLLREMDFGQWEGLTYEEIETNYPQELAAWQDDMMINPPPDGESLGNFSERVSTFLEDIKGRNIEEKVLIVSHGGVLQVMCCIAMGLPPRSYWQFRLDLASISAISFYPQGAILNRLNDTRHLENLAWEK